MTFSLTKEDVLVRGHGDEATAQLADRLQSILNVARDACGTAKRNPGFNETGRRDAIGRIGRATLEELDKAEAATRPGDLEKRLDLARGQLLAPVWRLPKGIDEADLPGFKARIYDRLAAVDQLERDTALRVAVGEADTLTLQTFSRLPPALRLVDEEQLRAARERLARRLSPEAAEKVDALESRRLTNSMNAASSRQAVAKFTGVMPDTAPVVTAY